jgi:hypothetical protein
LHRWSTWSTLFPSLDPMISSQVLKTLSLRIQTLCLSKIQKKFLFRIFRSCCPKFSKKSWWPKLFALIISMRRYFYKFRQSLKSRSCFSCLTFTTHGRPSMKKAGKTFISWISTIPLRSITKSSTMVLLISHWKTSYKTLLLYCCSNYKCIWNVKKGISLSFWDGSPSISPSKSQENYP